MVARQRQHHIDQTDLVEPSRSGRGRSGRRRDVGNATRSPTKRHRGCSHSHREEVGAIEGHCRTARRRTTVRSHSGKRRSVDTHLVKAGVAGAVRIHVADLGHGALGRARTAAVHVCLGAVLDNVRAGRDRALVGRTDTAGAVRSHPARFGICTLGASTATAVYVGLRAIFDNVRAGWNRAELGGIADSALAVCCLRAALQVPTLQTRGTAAVRVCLGAIFHRVIASRCDAGIRHTDIAQAVAGQAARLAINAGAAGATTAVNVGLYRVLRRIGAGRNRAEAAATHRTGAVRSDRAGRSIGTQRRAAATTVQVTFRAILHRIATGGSRADASRTDSALTVPRLGTSSVVGTLVGTRTTAVRTYFSAILYCIGAAWDCAHTS